MPRLRGKGFSWGIRSQKGDKKGVKRGAEEKSKECLCKVEKNMIE